MYFVSINVLQIVTQLKKWAAESPVAKWVDITKGNYTIMENPIHMMIVDDLSSGQIESAKKTIMVVAGKPSIGSTNLPVLVPG